MIMRLRVSIALSSCLPLKKSIDALNNALSARSDLGNSLMNSMYAFAAPA